MPEIFPTSHNMTADQVARCLEEFGPEILERDAAKAAKSRREVDDLARGRVVVRLDNGVASIIGIVTHIRPDLMLMGGAAENPIPLGFLFPPKKHDPLAIILSREQVDSIREIFGAFHPTGLGSPDSPFNCRCDIMENKADPANVESWDKGVRAGDGSPEDMASRLRQWEEMFGPVIGFAQENAGKLGLKWGDSISGFVIELLKSMVSAPQPAPMSEEEKAKIDSRSKEIAGDRNYLYLSEESASIIVSILRQLRGQPNETRKIFAGRLEYYTEPVKG